MTLTSKRNARGWRGGQRQRVAEGVRKRCDVPSKRSTVRGSPAGICWPCSVMAWRRPHRGQGPLLHEGDTNEGLLDEFIPEFDASVVAKLKASGAVLLGKLTTTEGAMVGYHRDFDIPVNPWGGELWAGVSSSGSGAATARSSSGCVATSAGRPSRSSDCRSRRTATSVAS